MSVPDSDMLISISEVLETPVSILLGETIVETKISDLEVNFRKIGDYKFTTRTKEDCKTKNYSRITYYIVCSYRNNFSGLN